MEPVLEYQWAFWDEVAARFVPTRQWLTDEEVRAACFAGGLGVYRLEYTRRERLGIGEMNACAVGVTETEGRWDCVGRVLPGAGREWRDQRIHDAQR